VVKYNSKGVIQRADEGWVDREIRRLGKSDRDPGWRDSNEECGVADADVMWRKQVWRARSGHHDSYREAQVSLELSP
jgi:hypothetical protein